MSKVSRSEFVFISLTLFSIFFGAGNLMFPPMLGYQSGQNLPQSLFGFLITAVVFPVIAVIVVCKANGFIELGNRVHPLFSKYYAIIMYLAIGPLLSIPRNASLSYTLNFSSFFVNNKLILFVYTLVFFGIAFWYSYHPNKLVSWIGKSISPILIGLIVILFVMTLIHIPFTFGNAVDQYATSPITKGFLDGFFTLDVLASLNYGIVVLTWFKNRQLNEKQLVKTTAKAGIVAGLVLMIIYIITSLIGANIAPLITNVQNGGELLSKTSQLVLGNFGHIVVASIFTLACFSVTVGLLTSCSEFAHSQYPKLSYVKWLIFFTITSLLLANTGLNEILKYSVPVLLLIYPVGIVLVILGTLENLIGKNALIYRSCIGVTFVISVLTTLNHFPILKDVLVDTHPLQQFNQLFPLYAEGLAWLIPFIIVLLITTIVVKTTSLNKNS